MYKGKDVQANLNVTVYKAEIYKCYVNIYFGGLIFLDFLLVVWLNWCIIKTQGCGEGVGGVCLKVHDFNSQLETHNKKYVN